MNQPNNLAIVNLENLNKAMVIARESMPPNTGVLVMEMVQKSIIGPYIVEPEEKHLESDEGKNATA